MNATMLACQNDPTVKEKHPDRVRGVIAADQIARLLELIDDPILTDIKDVVVPDAVRQALNARHAGRAAAAARLIADLGGRPTAAYLDFEEADNAEMADRERAWFMLGLLSSDVHRQVLFGRKPRPSAVGLPTQPQSPRAAAAELAVLHAERKE